MFKITIWAAILWITLISSVRADEGMWLLPLIESVNMEEMTSMGLELNIEDIYNVNHSSLKDAVVALDYGGCTAEFISSNGLLLTNHHCAYSDIQIHSTLEKDYLSNGFWAASYDEELPNKGKTVSRLVRMERVTDRVSSVLNEYMSEQEREDAIDFISETIEKEATKGTHHEAFVRSFYEGNEYYLVLVETFKDVRLVGAPPEDIGKFGFETDNWMWPRHTGDFSLYRVYVAPDGSPAEYSPDNVPYEPLHHLPVSLKGFEEGDFAMILGFPGRTDRYLTSHGVEELLEITHPNRIRVRGLRQKLMMEDMLSSEKIRLQYADKYDKSSNYWKYSIGQSEGLKNLNVIEKKRKEEEVFREWVTKDPERQKKYGEVLETISSSIRARKEYKHAAQYLAEALFNGIEITTFAIESFPLYIALMENPDDPEKIRETSMELRPGAEEFFKNYNQPTDKKIAVQMLQLFVDNVDESMHPDVFAIINNKYRGNFEKYMDKLFRKSVFADPEKLDEFYDSPEIKVFEKDMAFQTVLSFYRKYFELISLSEEYDNRINKARWLYLEALMEMHPEKNFYPDANSTMRLTYGTVGDYKARDAVYYDYYTTLKGVMEKEDPDSHEFQVPEGLKELYAAKDFGPYGMNGRMPVCFITNNDITGGNSGSPVINGKGELIGTAFDGNWEAMSGDVAFEPDIQKTISVDIRYVLFVIEKYAGARNLINEMTIVQ